MYDEYHEFLRARTLKSRIYRKYFLYPRLCKYLTGKALDIGPGIGDFVAFRPNTIGVDINPNNVEFCRKERGLDIRLMEINSLPFDNDEFDSVNMDNVLEHIEEPAQILAEITRVLKKNGVLVVGVPGILGFKTGPDHEVFYSKDDLVATFNNLGYSTIKTFSMPFESDWLDSRMRQYCYYGVFRNEEGNKL